MQIWDTYGIRIEVMDTDDISMNRKQREKRARVIYCKELGNAIIKAEKYHDLPSASGKPRKANCIVLVLI